MRVLVVLLHACFSVVSPIPFLLAAIFFSGHPYILSKYLYIVLLVHAYVRMHVGLQLIPCHYFQLYGTTCTYIRTLYAYKRAV